MLRKAIGFLRRLLFERVADDVFRTSVNGKCTAYDPLAVWRRIEQVGGSYWIDIIEPLKIAPFVGMPTEAIESLHRDRQASISTIAGWIRHAFELPPFPAGPTDAGCMDMLVDLLNYVNRMNDAYRPFLISKKRDAPSASTQAESQPA